MKYRDNRTKGIFAFICQYAHQQGFPPTIGEIASHEGFKSNSGVIRHLDKLEKWGWIERFHGHARSIRILRPCESPAEPGAVRQGKRPMSRLFFRRQ